MSIKKAQKRADPDKTTNYRNLLNQYYDRDAHLSDVKATLKQITPEIEILEELNEFEKKIDVLIKTKRYDVQELYMKPPQRLKRLLRVQICQEEINNQQVLKVFGSLHPKREDFHALKFTSFVRQIQFSYEREKNILETWKKPTSTSFIEKNGVVIKLPKNNEQVIGVSLFLIANPPKFKFDVPLQTIVGMKSGTRVQILEAFWQYVKKNKLQDVENKQIINSDDNLRQLFKNEKLTFASMNNRIRELLMPIDPIRLLLRPDQRSKVFDIVVEIEEKPDVDIVPFFSQKLNEQKNDHPFLSLVGKIKKYDSKFKDHSEKLRRHLAKRDLYLNFKKEKVEQIIMEQHRLLRELSKADSTEEHNRLQFLLQNEDEVEKQIKHYFEQVNSGALTNLSAPRAD